jgi:hypothetical protein
MICGACGEWQEPEADPAASTLRCPGCGYLERRWFPPLFIVTGASGAGKSAVLPLLRRRLKSWEVFDTDIMWDSAGDYQMARGNWLRIAYSIAEAGRSTLLCGVHLPESVDAHPERRLFGRIHYLALTCTREAREARLRARPAWRGITDGFIEEQHAFAGWLEAHAGSRFDPPLTLVDTSTGGVDRAARRVAAWARARRADDWHPDHRWGPGGCFHF